MSLLILLTSNELHTTFKTMKAKMYVQKLLDFISHRFETARRKSLKFIQILTTLRKLVSFLFPFYLCLFEYRVFNIVVIIIYRYIILSCAPSHSVPVFSYTWSSY